MRTSTTLKDLGGNIMRNESVYLSENNSKFIPTVYNHTHNRSITTNYSGTVNNTSGFYSRFNKSISASKFLTLNTLSGDGWFSPSPSLAPSEARQMMKDADKIVKTRNRITGYDPSKKALKRKIYIGKSRDICLTNYIIEKIKERRTELNEKQNFIVNSLKNNEKRLDNDYKNFIDFVDSIKIKDKKREDEYFQAKQIKDTTEDNYKKEVMKNKKLYEHIDIMLKEIVNLKNFGSFVHKVFDVPFILDNIKINKITRTNSLYFTSEIIKTIENDSEENKKEQEALIKDLFNNDELLMQKYSQIESVLVVIMKEKDILKKEISEMEEEQKVEITQLKARAENFKEEYKDILFDKREIENEIKNFKTEHLSENALYMTYITELGDEIMQKKNKEVDVSNILETLSVCKDILNALELKEKKINSYILQIEKVLKDGNKDEKKILEDLITKRKLLIKRENQIRLKKEQDDLDYIKKINALERGKRIIFRGRNIFSEYPNSIKKKNKKIKDNYDTNDDFNFIYYFSD